MVKFQINPHQNSSTSLPLPPQIITGNNDCLNVVRTTENVLETKKHPSPVKFINLSSQLKQVENNHENSDFISFDN